MEREERQIRQAMIDTCRAMEAKGLNQGTSGNLSVRHGDGLLVTPSGIDYAHMVPHDIVQMDWEGCFSADHRPSSEWRFHRDLLAARAEVDVVLHCHSTFATALACHERGLPPFHYMVAVAGGHDVRVSRYAGFATQELSNALLEAIADRRACLLAHHGLVTVASTLDRALWLAVEIEALARMYLHALVLGEPPHLSAAEMDATLEKMRRMSYGMDPVA